MSVSAVMAANKAAGAGLHGLEAALVGQGSADRTGPWAADAGGRAPFAREHAHA